MPRLSRQENQQLTRLKLIEAAEREILRVGIFDASIRQICESAGYTLGAFYSNFENKDELLLEVVEVQTKRDFDSLEQVLKTSAHSSGKAVLENLAECLRHLQANQLQSGLSLEFGVYANHNKNFKERYTENKKQWHTELAKFLGALFAAQNLSPKIPLLQMAIGFSALWNGFAIEGQVPGADPADKIILMFLKAFFDDCEHSQQPM